jgi:hypothetical protein
MANSEDIPPPGYADGYRREPSRVLGAAATGPNAEGLSPLISAEYDSSTLVRAFKLSSLGFDHGLNIEKIRNRSMITRTIKAEKNNASFCLAVIVGTPVNSEM